MSTPTSGELKFSDLNTTFGNDNSELKFSEYSGGERVPAHKLGSGFNHPSGTIRLPTHVVDSSAGNYSTPIGSDDYIIVGGYDNEDTFFGAKIANGNDHDSKSNALVAGPDSGGTDVNFGVNQSVLVSFGNSSSSSGTGLSTTSAPAVSGDIIARQTTRYVYVEDDSASNVNLTAEFLEDATGKTDGTGVNRGVVKFTATLSAASVGNWKAYIIGRDQGNATWYIVISGAVSSGNQTASIRNLSMSQFYGLSMNGFTDTWPSGITTGIGGTWVSNLSDTLLTSFGGPGSFFAAMAIVGMSASLDTSNQRIIITTTSVDSNGSQGTGVDQYYIGYSSALTNNAVFSFAWEYPDQSGDIYQFSSGNGGGSGQQFITVPPIADEGSHTVRTRTLSAGTGAIGTSITWSARAQVINSGNSFARISLGTGTNVKFTLRVVDSTVGIDSSLSATYPIAASATCEAT